MFYTELVYPAFMDGISMDISIGAYMDMSMDCISPDSVQRSVQPQFGANFGAGATPNSVHPKISVQNWVQQMKASLLDE